MKQPSLAVVVFPAEFSCFASFFLFFVVHIVWLVGGVVDVVVICFGFLGSLLAWFIILGSVDVVTPGHIWVIKGAGPVSLMGL
jgi:hypothetical protein